MKQNLISSQLRIQIANFINKNRKNDLLSTYLFFLEKRFKVSPVVFPPGKMIFRNKDEALKILDESGKVWRELEIKIQFGKENVNEDTKRIYICPFTGKVFGDNTHPNPQDAIYDWVSSCPENKERLDGIKVKRFHVSEDPEIIKNYITKREKTITKKVCSSATTGKLFNSREAVVEDFMKNYLKPMTLVDVQNQSRFDIEADFLEFLQESLDEEAVTTFVEKLAEDEGFHKIIAKWTEEEEDEEAEVEEESELEEELSEEAVTETE